MSSRYPSLVRLVVLLCALLNSPEDGFIRVVRFACGVNLWVYLVLPSRFSECCVSYLSEGLFRVFSWTYDPSSFCLTI